MIGVDFTDKDKLLREFVEGRLRQNQSPVNKRRQTLTCFPSNLLSLSSSDRIFVKPTHSCMAWWQIPVRGTVILDSNEELETPS